MKSQDGFSLIEVMVVCAVIGILSVVAIPSFNKLADTMRQRQGRAQVWTDIQRARQLAITRHSQVVMSIGVAPSTTDQTSYSILIDSNGDRVAQSTERKFDYTMPKNVKLKSITLTPVDSLVFDVSGILQTGFTGGRIVIQGKNSPDTLLVSAAGVVYRP